MMLSHLSARISSLLDIKPRKYVSPTKREIKTAEVHKNLFDCYEIHIVGFGMIPD